MRRRGLLGCMCAGVCGLGGCVGRLHPNNIIHIPFRFHEYWECGEFGAKMRQLLWHWNWQLIQALAMALALVLALVLAQALELFGGFSPCALSGL